MSETDSLSTRVRAELLSLSSVVILTAAVVALGGAYALAFRTGDANPGIGALLTLGTGVPSLYEEWPARYDSALETCLLTALLGVLAFGLYAFVFWLAAGVAASVVATVLAILVTSSVLLGVQLFGFARS